MRFWSISPFQKYFTRISPNSLLIAEQVSYCPYYPFTLDSLKASQFLPFFLKILSLFFRSGCRLIQLAFSLETLIKSSIILVGGKGNIPSEFNLFEICSMSQGKGLGLFSLQTIELFHDNLIPFYVTSISSRLPLQQTPFLNMSICPLSRILEMLIASQSSNLLGLVNALLRTPQGAAYCTTKSWFVQGSLMISQNLTTQSEAAAFTF